MSWYRARNLKVFDQLIWTPPESLTDQFRQSFLIRGLWKNNTFTMETNLLFKYFPFLAPEKARLVVMGVRLGLAAHVICYVAESIVSHKISGRPTKIFENYEAVGDSEAYEMYVNVSERISWKEEYIRPYDIGDSVAQADMITTWLRHTFPCDSVETEPNYDKYEPNNYQRWDWMEERAAGIPDGVFWSGRWCPGKDELKGGAGKNENIGMRKLQNVLIRDDGREAVCIEVKKITSACQRLGIIFPDDPTNEDEKRGSLFSPRFNRYLRAADNYNLNEDGRALFRAILTMNSDKLAHAWEIRYKDENGVSHVKWDRFEIYVEDDGTDAFIYPVREDWKERYNKGTTTFVRYWEGFKSTHGPNYNGCIDPLSVRQAAFFLNCYGMADGQDNGIFIHLNASPWGHRGGLSLEMDCETADRVWLVRNALKKVTGHLLMERESTFSTISSAIIYLWKTLDDGVESTIPRLKKWESQAALLDLTHGFAKQPDRMYSDYTKLLMKKMNFKE